jgi:outer membrane protein OmpA-like peptidoglycan-associated protein
VDELPAAAKALFAELAKCETLSGAELRAEYEKINQTIRARVVDTIAFQTGSSRINLDKVDETRLAVQASGQGSFFLVVGYASKTGNFDTNRKLAADRATALASVVDQSKMGTQRVSAVFFGQTDRFSSSDPLKNQICEIWEIRE